MSNSYACCCRLAGSMKRASLWDMHVLTIWEILLKVTLGFTQAELCLSASCYTWWQIINHAVII